MLTLAIDTSGRLGSLALARGGQLIEEVTLELGQKHGQVLIPEMESLLARAACDLRSIELLAVSHGPGSYTGLRVGIVAAKTLWYALRCQLVAIPTHAVIAEAAPSEVSSVTVISDAQKCDLFVSAYTREAAGWCESEPLRIQEFDHWLEAAPANSAVTGPGLIRWKDAVAGRLRVLPDDIWQPRAQHLARLAQRTAAQGVQTDPWMLEPLYLRRSSAEVQWEKLHGPGV